MSDGMFEMLLVKTPRDPLQLAELLHAVTTQNFYETDMITFLNGKEFKIAASPDVSWSLDGEFQEGCGEITISNLHSAIGMVLAEGGKAHG